MTAREFINNAVYIVFDGMSYYGLFGCWQEIRYSKRGGRPFITMFGKRLYLDEFVRNNSGF